MSSSNLWNDIKANPGALVAAVVLHVIFAVLLGISLSSSEVPESSAAKKKTINAVVVDAGKVDAELKKIKQVEKNQQLQKKAQDEKIKQEAEKARQQVEQEKLRLAKLKKQQDVEKKRLEATKKKAAAEQKRKAALEDKRKLEQQKKKQLAAEEERRRRAEEAELKSKLEEEERQEEQARLLAQKNEKLKSLRAQYVKLIEQKVQRNWLRPATVSQDVSCSVYVTQSALGDVINVRLQECASDLAFQRSVEHAVRKASPLPPPPSPEVFDQEIHFTFRPQV